MSAVDLLYIKYEVQTLLLYHQRVCIIQLQPAKERLRPLCGCLFCRMSEEALTSVYRIYVSYKNVMTAAAPKIMLMVLKRLFTTAKKVNTRCATVPDSWISLSLSRFQLFILTISDSNYFQNGMCLWDAFFTDHS